MNNMRGTKDIVVIVAHPDDETLWCGGTMLTYSSQNWFVICLSRKNDPDRARNFKAAMKALNARGVMGNLEDGPGQKPLERAIIKTAILELLGDRQFDLMLTHSPFGEYTRHLRHEEIGRAVIDLWSSNKIAAKELWTFAFEDGNREYLPQAIVGANIYQALTPKIWKEKYRIITEVYGFEVSGFEARTTPENEAFWKFETPRDAQKWLEHEGVNL